MATRLATDIALVGTVRGSVRRVRNLLLEGWEEMSWLLFAISVVFYTLSQKAQHTGDTSKNKYKQPLQVAPGNWYYKLFSLKYKERFPLSGSLLIAFTDAYHAWQLGFKVFFSVAIVTYRPLLGWGDALIYFFLFGVVFTIAYRK